MARSKKLPLVCSAIIGREAQIEIVERLLTEAAEGAGRVALISGADGLGRSCLLAELIRRAKQRAPCLWQATAWPGDALRPYATLLRLCASAHDGESAVPGAEALQRAVASVAARLAEPISWDVLAGAAPLDPSYERRRYLLPLLDALRQLAASGAVLITLDDAHLADEMTWAFLRALAPVLPRLPVLLALSYRDEPAPPDELQAVIALLARQATLTRLPLEPLSAAETVTLARALMPPAEALSPEVEAALYPITQGSPYAVVRTLAALRIDDVASASARAADAATPDTENDEAALPSSAWEAVRRQVARLSPRARDALAELAISGGEPSAWHVGTDSAGEPPGRMAGLRELLAGGLVAENTAAAAPARLVLHHLTCEAVVADLAPEERVRLHRAAAERLARTEEARAALAEHVFAAGEWELALTHARQAGERALALAAPRAAVALLTRALAAAATLERATPELWCARAEAYRQLGDIERARADDNTALAQARESGDRPTEWRALHDQGVLWMARDYTRAGQCFERSYTVARALGEPTALVASLNRMGLWHLNMDRPQDALHEHRKALAIPRTNERIPNVGETLYFLGIAALTGGDAAQAAAYYAQGIPLLRESNQQQRLSSSLATLAVCGLSYQTECLVCVPSDQLDGVRYAEMAVMTARQIGWRDGEAYALLSLASCLGPRGEFARALKVAQQALRIAEDIEHAQWTVAALWMLGTLHRALLVLPSAAAYLERGLALAREIGSWHWQRVITGHLATLYMIEGDFARAEALLDATQVVDAPPRSFGQQCVICARVDLAMARGEPQQAIELVDGMLTHASDVLPERPIPRLARSRGDALAVLGRRAEAEATLRAARHEAATQGAYALQWYLDVSLARLLHGQGRDSEATRTAQGARATIETLATRVPDASLNEPFRKRALSMLPPTSSPASRRALKEAFDGLTAREREVAALIAQGKSNRAIAEALVVSERTAETHVGNILNKLGFSSRAQIAAWAAEKLRTVREETREETP